MSEIDLQAFERAENYGNKKPMDEINDALKECQFGWFHVMLLSIAFSGFIAGVIVSTTTAYLLPSAECDLNMSLLQKGVLNAMPYAGMLLSTAVSGFLTDTFGRKIFVIIGDGGIFLFTLIAATSQSYDVLLTAKFLEGILFATAFNASLTLTSEFCHNGMRDRVLLCQSSFAALSQIIVPGLSWAILTQEWRVTLFNGFIVLNTWNFYLYLMALWSLLATALYFIFIPESPKFLLAHNRYDEAREVLIKIYKMNTRKPVDTFRYKDIWKDKTKHAIKEDPDEIQTLRHQLVVGLHNIKPMFEAPLSGYLALICTLNFIIMALYNVLRLWFPQLSTIVEHNKLNGDQDLCALLDNYTMNLKSVEINMTSTACVPHLSGKETYINSMIMGLVCVIPFFLTGILVNKVGKKILFLISGVICLGAVLCIRWANTKAAIVALFAVGTANAQVMMGLNQAVVIQFFPTTTRTFGIALVMMVGRIGTLVGNIAFPVLLKLGCVIPFYTMTAMMACVTVLSLFLPVKK